MVDRFTITAAEQDPWIDADPSGQWVRYSDYAALEAQLAEAEGYLRNLLVGFVQEHFPDNTEWKPLEGDLMGLLTQMDNASTIAREYKAQLAERVKVKALEWEERSGAFYADTALGEACIDQDGDGFYVIENGRKHSGFVSVEAAKSLIQKNHNKWVHYWIDAEALSHTGAVKVKALDEDDYEEIISAAAINMRKAASGIRGQMVTVQDSLDWWVMKETERRILFALEPAAPEGQQEPVAWRWKPKDSEAWIYDPKREWLEAQSRDEIDAEPLYLDPPPTSELEAENARLRKALEPFAGIADLVDSDTEGMSDADELELHFHDYLMASWSVSMFRAARHALSASEQKEGE